MKTVGVAVAFAVALGAAPVVAVALLRPEHRALAGDVYLLALGGVALLALVVVTRVGAGSDRQSPFDQALHPPAVRPERLPELATIERQVALGLANDFDFHVRLRPILREVAVHRLASRRGIQLDTDAEAAAAALGPEAWELLRPDRELPDDRFAPGPDVRRLRAIVDLLERI